MEDQLAREKVMRFDHERIPDCAVHRGGGAVRGTFPNSFHAKRCTLSQDTVRDVRGFATKFYTQEGNWDLVGNDIPVFFIQELVKFPGFVHAVPLPRLRSWGILQIAYSSRA
jgi:catalase